MVEEPQHSLHRLPQMNPDLCCTLALVHQHSSAMRAHLSLPSLCPVLCFRCGQQLPSVHIGLNRGSLSSPAAAETCAVGHDLV